MLLPLENSAPVVGQSVFIAPDAWVIGNVTLGDNVSVFFGSVLRGDIQPIRVGSGTNIQEHSLLHTSGGRSPAIVGCQVTIGHRAIVHGATVGDRSLIGMGAIILDDAVIGEECLIGAGSLVTEGKQIPRRSLVIGTPAKVIRTLTDDEAARLVESAASYVRSGSMYQQLLGTPPAPK